MTYLFGLIFIVLLIALVLVFRPPKPKRREDVEEESRVAERAETDEKQLLGRDKEEYRETAEFSEEEALTLDEPAGDHLSEDEDYVEEFDLDFVEGVSEESSLVVEEKASEEYDDIPFIDEESDVHEKKGEVVPALEDIPDDFAQTVDDVDETPEELSERLEYFLGTRDEKEPELDVEEPLDEQEADTAVTEEGAEASRDTVETEPVVEEMAVESPDAYEAELGSQEEKLRSELNKAIQNRESGKLSWLGVALENLCVRQADISGSFQQFQKQLEEIESIISELQQALPGFQMETAQASLRKGEYEVVRNMLADAVTQLENTPQLGAKILSHWGMIEEERGEFGIAQDMYTKASKLDDKNLNHLFMAGRMARITGDMENALPLLEKRVAAGQDQGEESIEFAKAEHELAKALALADDDKDRMEQLLTHAKESMEKMLGNDHSDLGQVLHDLAVFNDMEGRYEQAEPLYQHAMDIIEKALGSESPRLGATLNRLAGLYEEIEMEEKSESLYLKALEIRQKVLGENHPDVGSIMGHLANLLKTKGKYDQAEPMYCKSLEIAEVALGKDHPNLSVLVNDMAELYSDMGNEEKAEQFQERAFSLFGLPGMGDGFVEMDKDTTDDPDDDNNQTVAGD